MRVYQIRLGTRGGCLLLHPDPARAYERGPPAGVLLQEASEFLGGEVRGFGALGRELLPNLGSRKRAHNVVVQHMDRFLRRALWKRKPEPVGDDVRSEEHTSELQ